MKPMSSESSGPEWERDAHAADVTTPSNSVFIANKNSGREEGRMGEGLTGKACTVEESPTVECEAEKETMPASTMKTHKTLMIAQILESLLGVLQVRIHKDLSFLTSRKGCRVAPMLKL